MIADRAPREGKPLRIRDAVARTTTWLIETDIKEQRFGRKPIPDDVLEYANFLRIEMTAARRGVLTRSRHPPSRATDESAWLWTSSAAEMAGCSLQTVQRAIRKGELPAVRLGGRYLIEKADLLPWIAERKHR